jgi:hypothetical protein
VKIVTTWENFLVMEFRTGMTSWCPQDISGLLAWSNDDEEALKSLTATSPVSGT